MHIRLLGYLRRHHIALVVLFFVRGKYGEAAAAAGGLRGGFLRVSGAVLGVLATGLVLLVCCSPALASSGGLTSTGVISGTVTDASSSSGAAGVTVSVSDANGDNGSAVTAADGTYTVTGLPVGSYTVEFDEQSANYVRQYYNDASSSSAATPVTVTGGQATPGIDAALAKGGQISGKVTAVSTGRGIQNASVAVRDSSGNDIADARTAADGTYTASSLPSGSYTVQFSDPSANYLTRFFDNGTSTGTPSFSSASLVPVTAGHARPTIDVALPTGAQISGTVTDASTSSAIQNESVAVLDSSGHDVATASTAADGTYTASGLPSGAYTVRFSDQHAYYITQYHNSTPSGTPSSSSATPVPITAGMTASPIDAALVKSAQISGTVTDASSHSAIQNAAVNVSDGNGNTGSAVTAANGSYTVTGLPAGSYKVQFADQAAGYVTQYYNGVSSPSAGTPVSVTAGQTASPIDAALVKSAQISGTVTAAASSSGIPGAEVLVSDTSGTPVGGASTRQNGTYTLTDLPPGTYTVEFVDRQANYVTQYYGGASSRSTATALTLSPGQAKPSINAALLTGGQLTGTVTDAGTHLGIANTDVEVLDSSGNVASSATTAADGSYTASGLPFSFYTVQFADQAAGYLTQYYDGTSNGTSSSSSASAVRVTSGQTAPGIDAALTKPHQLTVSLAGAGSGNVMSSPSGINCGSTCSTSFLSVTQVTLTASAPSGSEFAGWSGVGCSGTGTCTVKMSSDQDITATFRVNGGTAGAGGPSRSGGALDGGGGGARQGGGGRSQSQSLPAAPKCSMTILGGKVLLKAPTRQSVSVGTLRLTVRCSQAASVTLGGTATLQGKKPRHGRAKNRPASIAALMLSVKAGISRVVLLELPRRGLAGRHSRVHEAVVLTLTAKGANGISHTATQLSRLGGL